MCGTPFLVDADRKAAASCAIPGLSTSHLPLGHRRRRLLRPIKSPPRVAEDGRRTLALHVARAEQPHHPQPEPSLGRGRTLPLKPSMRLGANSPLHQAGNIFQNNGSQHLFCREPAPRDRARDRAQDRARRPWLRSQNFLAPSDPGRGPRSRLPTK